MTTNCTESDLINKLRQGERKSYAQFIDAYKDMVFSLSLKMMKDREEAEEVAQDSFIKAIRSIHSFKGDSKLSTWLYSIVYRNCLDRLKLKRHQYKFKNLDDEYHVTDSDALTALDLMERDDLKSSVKNCLGKLNPNDNFILTLFYFEEKSLEELGKVLNITPNNAKIKLYRARKRLSILFKQYLEPELIKRYESAK